MALRAASSRVLSHTRPIAARAFAAKAKPEEDDFVVEVFKKQQSTFRAVMDSLKKIKFPFGATDEASIKAFAGELDKIKTATGITPMGQRYELMVEQQATSDSVREFLTGVRSQRSTIGMSDDLGVDSKLLAAVDKVEKSLGSPLLFSNAKGMATLEKELKTLETDMGLGDSAKLEAAAKYDEAKHIISRVSTETTDAMDMVKQRDGLKDVSVDLASLSVK